MSFNEGSILFLLFHPLLEVDKFNMSSEKALFYDYNIVF